MASDKPDKVIRIALIGITGGGKSSVGNTLLGEKKFESTPASESVTLKCDTHEAVLEPGIKVKVADTPGVYDTSDVSMMDEVIKFFEFLAPGPHALLLVIPPNRISKRDVNILNELQGLFEDDHFLQNTILVFTRKNDICGEYGEFKNIHKFIENCTNKDIQSLYEKCGKRAIAVENKQSWEQRKIDAKEVVQAIDKLEGIFDHKYFLKTKENEELKRKLNQKRCNIM